MNYMDDASTFERSLLQKARQKHIPVTGALELLPLCNMNCDMCYVRLSRSEMERQGRLRTVEEWVRLAEQMQKAGTVFLLLTGGEPLLFPDFKTLYRRLRNLGMILTINTNGTLLDEAWADFFATYPPRRINITLYGADAASYDRLCHFPQGFDQTLRAVRLLRARNVDVKISCSVTKKNPQDFSRIFALGQELGVPVHADHYMMPAVRERSLPFDAQVRLHPGDAAALAFQALKLQLDADIFRQYVRESVVSTTRLSRGGTVTFPVLPGTAPSLSTGRAGFSPVSCFQSCRHRSLISAFWQPGKRFPQKPGIFRLAQNAGNAVSGQSAVPVQLLPF